MKFLGVHISYFGAVGYAHSGHSVFASTDLQIRLQASPSLSQFHRLSLSLSVGGSRILLGQRNAAHLQLTELCGLALTSPISSNCLGDSELFSVTILTDSVPVSLNKRAVLHTLLGGLGSQLIRLTDLALRNTDATAPTQPAQLTLQSS